VFLVGNGPGSYPKEHDMPAYFDTGFSVRKPMWHGQGLVLDDYPTDWEDARKKAGLLWEPTYADLFVQQVVPAMCRLCLADLGQLHSDRCELETADGWVQLSDTTEGLAVRVLANPSDPNGSPTGVLVHVPATGHQAIVRDDTWGVLATPTDSYKLIQHSQMGELLDAYSASWRKAGAEVKFETAGSVRGGAMVWALVWLDEPYTVKGDDSPTYPFAALLNAHDGSAACKLLPTQVRIVCWNTWKAAEAEGNRTGNQVVLRHSGNVDDRLEAAKASLGTMRDEAKAWELLANDLAGININDAVVRTFLDEFIPIPEGATERTRNARLDRQSLFMGLLAESPTCAPLAPTAYKLVQAAGEYLDHLRPFRSQDTYLARTLFTNEPIKGGVVKLVRRLAAEMA
jgi:phage/plasmid-like protein (TIGR03299 family)